MAKAKRNIGREILEGLREIKRGETEDRLTLRGHPPPGADFLWALSNHGRERSALVRLDRGAVLISPSAPASASNSVGVNPVDARAASFSAGCSER